MKNSYGEKSDYFVQFFCNIAIIWSHLNPESNKYFEQLSNISDQVYGMDSARSLTLQFLAYKFLYVSDHAKYFSLIDSIGDKFLEKNLMMKSGLNWALI